MSVHNSTVKTEQGVYTDNQQPNQSKWRKDPKDKTRDLCRSCYQSAALIVMKKMKDDPATTTHQC